MRKAPVVPNVGKISLALPLRTAKHCRYCILRYAAVEAPWPCRRFVSSRTVQISIGVLIVERLDLSSYFKTYQMKTTVCKFICSFINTKFSLMMYKQFSEPLNRNALPITKSTAERVIEMLLTSLICHARYSYISPFVSYNVSYIYNVSTGCMASSP